jgi:hypothetical protein
MNTLANISDIIPAFAALLIGLIGLIILVMAVLMPVYVYLIYRQGIKNQMHHKVYERGLRVVIAHIDLINHERNTPPPTD